MIRREFLIGTMAFSAFPTSVFAYADALIVNGTKTCSCCGAWVERMSSAGFRAEVKFVNDEELGSVCVSHLAREAPERRQEAPPRPDPSYERGPGEECQGQ